jgi:holo-[acyl-carrier protein] synthase
MIGLDIVEIERIRKLASRNPRFLTRVFSADEIRYCRSKKRAWQHFAVRFAAKEAVWKALGRGGVALSDIAVHSGTDGRPSVRIAGKPPRPSIEISLSHSEHYAVAVALVQK